MTETDIETTPAGGTRASAVVIRLPGAMTPTERETMREADRAETAQILLDLARDLKAQRAREEAEREVIPLFSKKPRRRRRRVATPSQPSGPGAAA